VSVTKRERYYSLSADLRKLFGCRVQKITVDAGLNCPNRDGTLGVGGCIYCNATGSGSGAFARGMSVKEQIEIGKKAMIRRYKAKKFLVYFQSYSNTYASMDHLTQMYREALAVEGVAGLCIGTRPDCISEPTFDLLADLSRKHLIWLELGLQSAHDQTLGVINRGHNCTVFAQAVEAAKTRQIRTCAHIILGLPGESRKMVRQTARFLADLDIDGVKLHLLYVVKGTPLERLYRKDQYRCLTRKEYVEWSCDVLERLPKTAVIHRLTGDPHPDELVAPQWSLDKRGALAAIEQRLEERDTRQGQLVGK
jgi:radical SAM protein (TIGR01212 family)